MIASLLFVDQFEQLRIIRKPSKYVKVPPSTLLR